MPFNDNLKLSTEDLQNLFGQSLYFIEELPHKQASGEKKVSVKKVMTVITGVPIPTEKENVSYSFLAGIFQACRVPATDVSLISSHSDEVNFKYIQDTFHSSLVLMFDITPGDIGLPVYFPHFQLQNFSGVTYLSAPDLASLQSDKLLKSKLWLCLKQYFSL